MAAAGLFALENNVSRLEEDHENARILGERLADIDGIDINLSNIQTNLIFFKVKTLNINAIQLSERLLKQGIRIGAMSEKDIRVVTHLDVDRSGILEASDAIAGILVSNTS